MGFHAIRFPTDVNWGTQGGPGIPTAISETDSGYEERVQRHSEPRHRYNAAYNIKRYSTLAQLKTFYLARGGLANGFLYKDWFDYNSTAAGRAWGQSPDDPGAAPTPTDQEIGTGDGTAQIWQLVKRYTDAGGTLVRKIRKPVAGTVRCAINGTEVFTFAIDHSTGLVTFATAPASGAQITWGGEFDVPVRFGEGAAESLAATADAFGDGSVTDVPLIELLDEELIPEDRYFGGATFDTIEPDPGVSVNLDALVWVLVAGAAGKKVYLPDLSGLPKGGPLLVIVNADATNAVDVQQLSPPAGGFNYVTWFTLNTGATAILFHGVDQLGAPAWYRY